MQLVLSGSLLWFRLQFRDPIVRQKVWIRTVQFRARTRPDRQSTIPTRRKLGSRRPRRRPRRRDPWRVRVIGENRCHDLHTWFDPSWASKTGKGITVSESFGLELEKNKKKGALYSYQSKLQNTHIQKINYMSMSEVSFTYAEEFLYWYSHLANRGIMRI